MLKLLDVALSQVSNPVNKGSRKLKAGISYSTCKNNVSVIQDNVGDVPIVLCIPLCNLKNFGKGKEAYVVNTQHSSKTATSNI